MLKHNFKRLRVAAGLTQVRLAEALDTSLRNVQNWEQGHREMGLSQLPKLARVLGTTIDELLAEPAPAPKKKPRGKS
jgi:transcriptional regulator with XRE-family HTH domain